MRVRETEVVFRRRLAEAGTPLENFTGLDAVTAMVRFFLEERADDIDPDADGDMLLFQYGMNPFGDGPSFEYDITRQLITADAEDDDDNCWQLNLTAYYLPTNTAKALGSFDEWCESPDEVDGFLDLVRTDPATAYVTDLRPTRVELHFGQAG